MWRISIEMGRYLWKTSTSTLIIPCLFVINERADNQIWTGDLILTKVICAFLKNCSVLRKSSYNAGFEVFSSRFKVLIFACFWINCPQTVPRIKRRLWMILSPLFPRPAADYGGRAGIICLFTTTFDILTIQFFKHTN